MKSLTESKLKALLKKAWEHGYENGSRDFAPWQMTEEALELAKDRLSNDKMVSCIQEGKLIELVGEA